MMKHSRLLVAVVAACGVFVLFAGGKASAQANPENSVVGPTTFEPRAGNTRALCPGANRDTYPLDFRVYFSDSNPSAPDLNLTSGRYTYTINLDWATCRSSANSRSYAIYSDSDRVCPVSGTYGEGGEATDCIKYIGEDWFEGPSGLTCPGGTDGDCLDVGTIGDRAIWADQPFMYNHPFISSQRRTINVSGVIPDWSERSSTGSYTISETMCQYYKFPNPSFDQFVDGVPRGGVRNRNARCQSVSITFRWLQRSTQSVVSCGNTSPAQVEVGQEFTLSTSFTNNGGAGSGNVGYGIRLYDFEEAFPPGNTQGDGGVVGFSTVARDGGLGNGQIPNILGSPTRPVLSTPGIHSGYFRINVGDASNSPLDCEFEIEAVSKPYYRVYGGDVVAGAGFMDDTSCSPVSTDPDNLPGIIGHNGPVSGGHRGAGSQLAAFAIGELNGFSTGQRKAVGIPTPTPDYLSFARGSGSPRPYGGQISRGHVSCMPDYFSTLPSSFSDNINSNTLTLNPGHNVPSTRLQNGRLTINTTPTISHLSNGESLTVYVNGDVYIDGNIIYSDGPYSSPEEIPSFRVIARGNIYVASWVTRLDGFYIAQPLEDGSKGLFYSCVDTDAPFSAPSAESIASDCGTKHLLSYGAVAAQEVRLTRSIGSLGDSSPAEFFNFATNSPTNGGNPAEVFIYSPSMWLKQGLSGSSEFDSYTSLPPIL